MGITEYQYQFSPTDWLRVYLETERGKVVKFLVQYETLISDQIRAVSRYDNAHGFIHQDIFSPEGKRIKRIIFEEYANEYALNMAVNDFKTRWSWYKEQFLKGR